VTAIYDHIVATLIFGALFVSAVFAVPHVSLMHLLYADQQQLRNVALEALKAMTLDVGSPMNWGSSVPFDQNGLTRFGLSHVGGSSFYVLDSDKVQRLVEGNPIGYVEYEKIRELLGLGDYGFCINIIPPFTAAWTKNSDDPSFVDFTVKVMELCGTPIPNAVVDVIIVYCGEQGNDVSFHVEKVESIGTEALGTCVVTEQLDLQPGEILHDVIVIFRVSVADLATLIGTYHYRQSPDFADAARFHTVGDDVILTIPPEKQPKGARWIDYLAMIDEEGNIAFLHNGTRGNEDKLTWGEGYETWATEITGLEYYGPVLFVGGIWGVEDGRKEVLAVGPFPNWLGPRVFQYGDASGPTRASCAVKLQRQVILNDMIYLFELILWREAPLLWRA
jgi:hypothetical protein